MQFCSSTCTHILDAWMCTVHTHVSFFRRTSFKLHKLSRLSKLSTPAVLLAMLLHATSCSNTCLSPYRFVFLQRPVRDSRFDSTAETIIKCLSMWLVCRCWTTADDLIVCLRSYAWIARNTPQTLSVSVALLHVPLLLAHTHAHKHTRATMLPCCGNRRSLCLAKYLYQ